MDARQAAEWLKDVWPGAILASDYEKAAALLLRLVTPQRTAVLNRAPMPAPVSSGPKSKVTSAPKVKRGRGRPPKNKVSGAAPLRVKVQQMLTAHPDGMTGADIAETLDVPGPSVYSAINQLIKDGAAERGDGVFVSTAAPG